MLSVYYSDNIINFLCFKKIYRNYYSQIHKCLSTYILYFEYKLTTQSVGKPFTSVYDLDIDLRYLLLFYDFSNSKIIFVLSFKVVMASPIIDVTPAEEFDYSSSDSMTKSEVENKRFYNSELKQGLSNNDFFTLKTLLKNLRVIQMYNLKCSLYK